MSNGSNKQEKFQLFRKWGERLGWKGGQSQPGQQSSGAGQQLGPLPIAAVKRFRSFVLFPLPAGAPDQYASTQQREEYANEIARQIATALEQHNLQNFSLLEIYTTPGSKNYVKQLFPGHAGAQDFERVVQSALWGARQPQGAALGRPSRIYLVPQVLEFNAAFDTLLGSALLLRPLGSGGVHIPKEPTQDYKEVAQILLGEIIIFDNRIREVGREEIWAWRAMQRENYFTLHVDFDLLHRAFPPRLRPFPLGIEISCDMNVGPTGKRQIDEVIFNVKEAKEWLERVNNQSVNYYLNTGKRNYRQDPLVKLPDDNLIDENAAPQDRKLGQDRTGQDIVVQINRDVEIVAESGATAYHYLFNFFERGANFTPQNNAIRVSGQFIPAGEKAIVCLPPTFEKQAENLFLIEPVPSGGFSVTALGRPLTITSCGTLAPNSSCMANVGAEIEPAPSQIGGIPSDQVRYTIRSIQGFPQEVVNGKNYAAFLEIQGNESSSLIAEEHTLGAGGFFPRNVRGLVSKALIFKRKWTRVTVEAGPGQNVWFGRDIPGLSKVEKLSDQLTLELNDYYRIYVGDFELRLDLASTPQSG